MKQLRIKWKELVKQIGYALGVAHSITLAYTFFNAYFSPTKCVKVCIDTFHEANAEAVIVPISIAIIIIGWLLYINDMPKKKKQDKEPIDIVFVQEL